MILNPDGMLIIVNTLLLLWTLASFVATRPPGRIRDAVLAGLFVGLATSTNSTPPS